jgi:hypothetical protein
MVYVDDMRMHAQVGRLRARWSHLTADTTDELHTFAELLGLKRAWFQPAKVFADTARNRERGVVGQPGWGSRDHYDVTDSKRDEAIRLGALSCRWGCEPWRDQESEEEDQTHAL